MRAVCFIGKFQLLLNCNNYENQTSKSRTSQTRKTLSVSVKRQPTHIQAHLVLPDTQSRPFAKPKELEFSQRTDDRN